jgi:phenylalanyl-tRNA synthetase alpha chain
MEEKIKNILQTAKKELEAATINNIDNLQMKILGRKSKINDVLKSLGKLNLIEKKKIGALANKARQEIEEEFTKKRQQLQSREVEAIIDFTAPGKDFVVGHLHPVTQVMTEILDIFKSLGYEIATGPEIEDDWHNFEALNIPAQHPARAMHDTFYVSEHLLLRTHTSPVQVHVMQTQSPPLKIIAPGRVYRCDSDITHSPMFHQVEGFFVDTAVSFVDLKGILADFLQQFFEQNLPTRFRPSYFPFTEPSAEMDMSWKDGWLEIGGCGMVHPNVLKHVNIDSEKYLGFAFGLGVERLAMLRYGVNDLRQFYESDLRFLKQFN